MTDDVASPGGVDSLPPRLPRCRFRTRRLSASIRVE